MSIKDKYLSIFSRQIEAVALIILQMFFAPRPVLKVGECHSSVLVGTFLVT